MRQTYETQIDLEDEYDVNVLVEFNFTPGGFRDEEDSFDITAVNRVDNGDTLILTQDITDTLYERLHENKDEITDTAEGDYADYRYELARDERMMEDM